MDGWIKIPTGMLDDPDYLGERFTKAMARLDLRLLEAAGRERPSTRQLAERWKWAVNTVRSFLKSVSIDTPVDTPTDTVIDTPNGLTESTFYNVTNTLCDTAVDTPTDTPGRVSVSSRVRVEDTLPETIQTTNPPIPNNPPDIAKAISAPLASPLPPAAETRKPAKRFIPPTAEEVRAYCEERGNGIDPEEFVDFYTANGWVQNRGKPIKDWRACVRTWEKNRKMRMPYGGPQQQQKKSTLDRNAEAMAAIRRKYHGNEEPDTAVDEQ